MAEQEGVLFHLRFFPEWTWTVTPFAMAVPASIYLLVVFLLVKWMNAREAFELRWVIRLYDVAQIVLCAYMTQGTSRRDREDHVLAVAGLLSLLVFWNAGLSACLYNLLVIC